MRAITALKLTALLVLLACMPAAAVKYVAVVESEVDAASGASADINPAEVRQITAELRRQATENLPLDRYNIMTTETVQSMGGAVLEECADENCVVTLGARIGADYIVRGTISKFGAKLTLSVEMYETDNGMLVITSEPVRAQNIEELLEGASGVSGAMYRKFAGTAGTKAQAAETQEAATQVAATQEEEAKESIVKAEQEAVAKPSESVMPKEKKTAFYFAPKYQLPVGTPAFWGGVNLDIGWVWESGWLFGIDGDFGYGYKEDMHKHYGFLVGGGLSLGKEYDLANQMQIVIGGTAGLWGVADRDYGVDQYTESFNFLGPFVKWRWRSVEIMYRGLLGIEDFYEYGIGYNSHQLMLGYNFGGRKPR